MTKKPTNITASKKAASSKAASSKAASKKAASSKAASSKAASSEASNRAPSTKTASSKAPNKAASNKASNRAPSTRTASSKAPSNKASMKAPSTKAPSNKAASKKAAPSKAASDDVSALIDIQIDDLGDWRGDMLGRLRAVIRAAAPDAIEELKWGGVPVWSDAGIITTGETYKSVVKLTFAKGASLPDPKKLFNSSLGGNTRRAIDFAEGASVDEAGLAALVRAAVALNRGD